MSSLTLPQGQTAKSGTAREQIEQLYRAIGISAVAAAAAQIARPVQKPEPVRHELPACLRDEVAA